MKKFSKVLSVTLAVTLMLATFAACSKDKKKESEESTKAETSETEEKAPETTVAETEVMPVGNFRSGLDIVNVEIISSEDLENQSNYMHYTNSFNEYAANVKFTFNENIEDFQFVAIDASLDDDGEIINNDIKMQYSCGSVASDMSIIITCDLPEILPINGITFTDADGNAHLLYIFVSGEDGHLFFLENLSEG